jgi:site-specific DNA-methyltransferase (adenine-specific)
MAMEAAGFRIKSQLVWDRVNHGMGDLKASFSPRHDVMWFGTKGKFAFHDGRPASVLPAARVPGNQLVHPNEKPLALMQALIGPTVPPGGIVLDPFMGSGATLLAAQSLGRGDGRAAGDEIIGAITRGSTSGSPALTPVQISYPLVNDITGS